MRERLADIFGRLPKGFYKRLMAVTKATGTAPEVVIDDGLKYQEAVAGIVVDSDLERQIVSRFHTRVAKETADSLGEHGRMLRARRGGYAKHAKRAGMSLDDYLKQRAHDARMSVEDFLLREN